MLLSNRWLTAKWATPRKAAGTAAERDGSTVGRVVVDGAITEDGGEVRHHGHQLGGIGESTAGGRGHLQAPEPSLRSAGSLWSQPCRCDNEEAPSALHRWRGFYIATFNHVNERRAASRKMGGSGRWRFYWFRCLPRPDHLRPAGSQCPRATGGFFIVALSRCATLYGFAH